MYVRYRKTNLTASSVRDSSEKTLKLADAAAKQAVIREIRSHPITDPQILRILCVYLLLDTQNIAMIDMDSNNRITNISSVPFCPLHALENMGYIKSLLGVPVPHQRTIGIHIENTTALAMELYANIVERFREITGESRAVYLLCHGFDTWYI